MKLQQIGTIYSPILQAKGAPIQPRYAESIEGYIDLRPEFAAGLKDLEGFERIWLFYWFHKAPEAKLTVTPFKDVIEHGVFATRAPCRPNPIGISCVKLLSIEGARINIGDVDVLNETPLLDIKPFAPIFDHYEVQKSGWLDKANQTTNADDRFKKTNED